jgi:hypothetical protein
MVMLPEHFFLFYASYILLQQQPGNLPEEEFFIRKNKSKVIFC